MLREIKEPDWKILRQLHAVALERFCQHVLAEIEHINNDAAKSYHQRYLEIFSHLERRDKELARTFDQLRRSSALAQLADIRSHGLLTDEEFMRFSPEIRSVIESLLS